MTLQNKRLLTIFSVAIGILLIPAIAMQFTNEINWSGGDFLIMGLLLFGAGIALEIILRKSKSENVRAALIIGLIVLFLLVWAELAVGILGTPLAGS